MERKVCFILDASNCGELVGACLSNSRSHHRQAGDESFYRWLGEWGGGESEWEQGEGLHAETAQSALTAILKLVI